MKMAQQKISSKSNNRSGTDLQDQNSYLRLEPPQLSGLTTILFAASSNKTYTVEFSDNVALGLWQKLDDLVARATNHVRVVTDPDWGPHRFYRVVTPRRP
jgi:hypothetical protein